MEKQVFEHGRDSRDAACAGEAPVGEPRGFNHSSGRNIPTSDDKNCYMFDGYKIRERFDPDGPLFTDCIVRVFS